MKKNWYAIYTKLHCEKKVAGLLAKRKIENYYPLNSVIITGNGQAGKKKTVYEPLLPSYIFVFITDAEIALVKNTSSVVSFIYWLGNPAVIQNDEILNLQHFISEYSNVKLEKTRVMPNKIAEITSEPHIDISGKVMSVKNTHIKLSLPSLGYRLVAEIEKVNSDVFNYGFERSKLVS